MRGTAGALPQSDSDSSAPGELRSCRTIKPPVADFDENRASGIVIAVNTAKQPKVRPLNCD
jgi:hypothetical protein